LSRFCLAAHQNCRLEFGWIIGYSGVKLHTLTLIMSNRTLR
jgi:hypothetical protein